ncbi:MAG: energy transducer TonB [Chitinophagales bacterium]
MKRKLGLMCGAMMPLFLAAQFVSRLDITDTIPGLCDKNEVYALFSAFKGQDQAKCPLTKAQIEARLNKEVSIIKEKRDLEEKGEVSLMINCKGEVIQCKIEKASKQPVLDQQVLAVFNSLGNWLPGKFNGREVDSAELYRFKVKGGKLELK